VSEERAGGDGFRRTSARPLLQERLVAVAALAAGGAGRLVGVGEALPGGNSHEAVALRARASSTGTQCACGEARSANEESEDGAV